MIKKIRKYLKVVPVDVLIYSMKPEDILQLPKLEYTVEKEILADSKVRYFITDKGICIHQSFLFPKLFLLRLIGKNGPAIGDCMTISEYKGKSIYPFVINYIAKTLLSDGKIQEVFINVNSDNFASIRGIEKAGFKLHAKIKAKRFLLFYFQLNKSIFR